MPPKKKGGRYTPPKRGANPREPDPRTRQPVEPEASRSRASSPPWFLAAIAVLWLGACVVVMLKVDAAWKLVPAAIFGGVGIFYLRAALQTVVRRGD